MEEAVHRRVPLAAGSASTGCPCGTPDGRIGQASHRRNPCPLCRPAPAGSQGEGGNGPVAGRLADAGGYLAQCQTPWRSRIINARPSPCRTMPPAADRCPCPGGGQAARDSPVGCGHHPAKFGPARNLRHPACHRESGACTPNPLPNGTACARPSGLSFPKLRRRGARRVFVRRSRAEPDHPFRRYSLS
jgi:hypothetical protein